MEEENGEKEINRGRRGRGVRVKRRERVEIVEEQGMR